MAILWTPSADPAIKDRRWRVGPLETSYDEFQGEALDPAWTRLDGTGAVVGNASWSVAADSLVAKVDGTDSSGALHGLMRPLSGVGGSMVAGDAFVTRVSIFAPQSNFLMGGLLLADGITYGAGNQAAGLAFQDSAGIEYAIFPFTNYNVAGGGGTSLVMSWGTIMFMRIVMVAANSWRVDVSPDGIVWVNGAATAKTVTPTHIGFLISSWGTTRKAFVKYDLFRRVSGV